MSLWKRTADSRRASLPRAQRSTAHLGQVARLLGVETLDVAAVNRVIRYSSASSGRSPQYSPCNGWLLFGAVNATGLLPRSALPIPLAYGNNILTNMGGT